MKLVRIASLPAEPLDAAAAFHAEWTGKVREEAADVLLVLPPADHTHRKWRLGAVQELAREAAPRRVNAIASSDEAAIDRARDYLAAAPGITGQYLPLTK
ncbi:Rossmann fold domain-containing protein [Pseudoblastomonas halimionae]|uniref:Short chain dehydrogenase-like proteobacteria domain-containing protein n=1 Tax=Alteriqipengyuania halimionae TaxID=1926630 RepID=A0A6I4TYI3_9SPHN|nr:hypothetical protein [Alteriqipengyuania halimionae]MXP08720.1 hypothetical protein [Alteriqipengyuania halimionae]